jgi:hypothetical protein
MSTGLWSGTGLKRKNMFFQLKSAIKLVAVKLSIIFIHSIKMSSKAKSMMYHIGFDDIEILLNY